MLSIYSTITDFSTKIDFSSIAFDRINVKRGSTFDRAASDCQKTRELASA